MHWSHVRPVWTEPHVHTHSGAVPDTAVPALLQLTSGSLQLSKQFGHPVNPAAHRSQRSPV